MAELAATGARPDTISSSTDIEHPRPLGEELKAEYARAYGRPPRYNTLEALVAFETWLEQCRHTEGTRVMRSTAQIVEAMAEQGLHGWQLSGRRKVDRRRYSTNVKNRLAILKRIGRITDYRPVYEKSGVGAGILIDARRKPERGLEPPTHALQERCSTSPATRSRATCAPLTASARPRGRASCTPSARPVGGRRTLPRRVGFQARHPDASSCS
jgi:hypothetical protein